MKGPGAGGLAGAGRVYILEFLERFWEAESRWEGLAEGRPRAEGVPRVWEALGGPGSFDHHAWGTRGELLQLPGLSWVLKYPSCGKAGERVGSTCAIDGGA